MSYLDYAAGAPLRPQARAAMLAAWEQVGNPSSAHAAGRAAAKLLEEARESLAADIGAHPAEIVFTSGGTEANNLALRGLTSGRIAVSAVEHPSLANAVGSLPNCESIPVGPDGRVAPAHLPNTALVCVQ
ncbi:MAG: aminotransferase class V-fold PLP-dependent enzyme, partial [Propionibacteriaceae bacterium]|nr:aminotransferase class V-fold PLP-dependent enzyme [Propionibacteriaceae bacterium]